MPISDLTWAQLGEKLPAGAIALAAAGDMDGKVVIDVSALTGDVIDSLTDTGVVELITKILSGCELAQVTVNEGVVAGDRLNSFPTSNYGSPTRNPTDGLLYAQRIQQIVSRAPLNVDMAIGTNI